MSSVLAPLTVTPAQLSKSMADRSHTTSTVLLDVTWFMPNSPRNAREEFSTKHIPDAQFFDLDEVASEHELGLKHMMPSPKIFADACQKFGISPSTQVILYDTQGVFSSPRALFTFRAFGHQNSSILDGGLPAWEAENFNTESGASVPKEKTIYPSRTLDTTVIRSYDQIVGNAQLDTNEAELVIDARSRGRFLGTDPEPRPDLSSGHIPNSFSLPFSLFLRQNTALPSSSTPGATYTTLLPPPEIKKALVTALGYTNADAVIQGKKSIVTTCGSGMTAAILWLGLRTLDVKNIGLYDESWTGYASRPSSVIVGL